jgi:signal transduction histidine kinase
VAGAAGAACAGVGSGAQPALWALGLALAAALLLVIAPLRRRRAAEVAVWRDAVRIAELTRVAGLWELSTWGEEALSQPITSILNNVAAAHRLLGRGPDGLVDAAAAVEEARAAGEEVALSLRHMQAVMGLSGGRQGPVHLNEVARQVVRLTRWQARAHGVAVSATLDPLLPPVRGDETRIFQLLLSLVLAAVDAAAGSSDHAVELRSGVAEGWIELTVRDSGRPISEADRPQLFAPFSALRRGGLGIGLYMARSIAEAHGGRLTAERPAAGALFRALLPPEAPAAAPAAPAAVA